MNSRPFDPDTPAAGTMPSIAPALPFPGDARATQTRWRPSVLVLMAEITLAALSFLLTAWILYDSAARSELPLTADLLIVVGLRSACLYLLGPFRSSFRHAGVHELLAITKAVCLSSLLIALLISRLEIGGRESFGLFVSAWAFCQILVGGVHFAPQIYQFQSALGRRPRKRVAMVGAGDAGMTLVKELASDPESPCRPTAIFDD